MRIIIPQRDIYSTVRPVPEKDPLGPFELISIISGDEGIPLVIYRKNDHLEFIDIHLVRIYNPMKEYQKGDW